MRTITSLHYFLRACRLAFCAWAERRLVSACRAPMGDRRLRNQQLGDLNRVERSTLAEVVRDAEQFQSTWIM
jgi:hypothetical protein